MHNQSHTDTFHRVYKNEQEITDEIKLQYLPVFRMTIREIEKKNAVLMVFLFITSTRLHLRENCRRDLKKHYWKLKKIYMEKRGMNERRLRIFFNLSTIKNVVKCNSV